MEQALIAKDLQDNLGKREDASIEAWNEVRQKISEIAETCDMKALETEGSISSYYCSDGRVLIPK